MVLVIEKGGETAQGAMAKSVRRTLSVGGADVGSSSWGAD